MPNSLGLEAPTLAERAAQVARSLHARYDGAPPGALFALHSLSADPDKRQLMFDYREVADIDQVAKAMADAPTNLHFYSRMTTLRAKPERGRGKEDDMYTSQVVWVDCDFMKEGLDPKLVLDIITSFEVDGRPLPPTLVEFSGGGYYAIWRLKEPETDWRRIKRVNSWLVQQLGMSAPRPAGADPASVDAARLLRLPGTFNCKPDRQAWAEIVYEVPGREYDLAEFGEVPVNEVPAAVYVEEPLPEDFLARVKEEVPEVYRRIASPEEALAAGAPLNAAGDGPARYRNDLYVCCQLLRRDGQIRRHPGLLVGVLTHPHWFSGSKYWETHSIQYVYDTIALAERLTAPANSRCFDGNKLVPSLLGDDIMRDDHYLNVGEKLHVYDRQKGVFRPDGDHHLDLVLHARLGNGWSPSNAHAVSLYTHQAAERLSLEDRDLHSPYINVRNGMLNVETRELRPHSPAYRSLCQFPVVYDPHADPTPIETFVGQILKPEDIRTWWQACGYLLWDRMEYKMAVLLYGPPDTGKSQMLDMVREFVGGHNASTIEPTELEDRFATSGLVGKLANICAEISTERKIVASETFKRLVAGDPVRAQHKGKDAFDFINRAKWFLGGNDLPQVHSGDDAFYRRFITLACENVFTEGVNAKPQLARALCANPRNMSAFLNLALDGLADLRASRGFYRSPSTHKKIEEMQRRGDSVYDFWLSTSVRKEGACIVIARAYEEYKAWCTINNRQACSNNEFGMRSTQRLQGKLGIVKKRRRVAEGNMWVYLNREFVPEEQLMPIADALFKDQGEGEENAD